MERRVELILRVPNLSPEGSAQIQAALADLAARLNGSLSRIERDHGIGYAMHVSRQPIVRRGQRVSR